MSDTKKPEDWTVEEFDRALLEYAYEMTVDEIKLALEKGCFSKWNNSQMADLIANAARREGSGKIADLEKNIKVAEDNLILIALRDKTPEYGYGRGLENMDRDGNTPTGGARWMTPREIIESYFCKNFWDVYSSLKIRVKNKLKAEMLKP